MARWPAFCGSRLPGQVRPAALWRIELDDRAELVDASVEPALVRSRLRLSYDEPQAILDGAPGPDGVTFLLHAPREVGRRGIERERGGVSLDVPEQEAVLADDGTWRLRFRAILPVEGWNAQISLLTGMAAARIMLDAGLRTVPPTDPRGLAGCGAPPTPSTSNGRSRRPTAHRSTGSTRRTRPTGLSSTPRPRCSAASRVRRGGRDGRAVG